MNRRRSLLCAAAAGLVAGSLWGCGEGGASRSASPQPTRTSASPSPKASIPPGAEAFIGHWKWTDSYGQGTLIIRLDSGGVFLVRDRGVTGGGGQGGQGWNYTVEMRCSKRADGALELRGQGPEGVALSVRLVGHDEIVVAPPTRHCFRAAGG